MTDKKPTDNEIIKALEEWRKELIADYQRLQLLDAPMDCFEESHADTITKLSNALDLFNRQKAENEVLKDDLNYFKKACADNKVTALRQTIKTAKSEAYKEFAERLKEKYSNRKLGQWNFEKAFIENIDNLLKEMVGECNAE